MQRRHRLLFFTAALVVAGCVAALLAPSANQAAAGAAGTGSSATPYGLALLEHPEQIMQLRPLVRAGQVSSHQKNGFNLDTSHEADDGEENYLYKNGSNYVLLHEEGPGTITRIWFYPEPNGSARLSIFFD